MKGYILFTLMSIVLVCVADVWTGNHKTVERSQKKLKQAQEIDFSGIELLRYNPDTGEEELFNSADGKYYKIVDESDSTVPTKEDEPIMDRGKKDASYTYLCRWQSFITGILVLHK